MTMDERSGEAPALTTVGVIGAGTMGAGIAQVAALAGHRVVLVDSAPGRSAAAVQRIGESLDRLVHRGRLPAERVAGARRRLTAGDTLADLGGCGLVVEAIVERLDVKQLLLAALEDIVDPACVLATNTSSLSITDIADGLEHPGRVVGMHFFNPAPVMRLVEVVSGEQTDPAVAEHAADLATAWGKTPVQVASSPGFVVNRVARPFYGEALLALAEGGVDGAGAMDTMDTMDAVTIDAVLRESGGFPMGPLQLTDLIGQDVNLATTVSVWEQRDRDPRFAPSPLQEELVAHGRLGRKTGQGFYAHDEGSGRAEVVEEAGPGTSTGPTDVVVHGDWGPWAPLWDRVAEAGVRISRAPGGTPSATLPGGVLVPTDGRTAAARSEDSDDPAVVLDLALDPACAARFAVALPPGCPRELKDAVLALLRATGAAVTVLPDRPGMLVARTVAMLADEAAATVDDGVASAADVDVAMRLGAGYPLGPLEWGDRLGAARLATLLDTVRAETGEPRYRVSEAVRRAAAAGGSLRDR